MQLDRKKEPNSLKKMELKVVNLDANYASLGVVIELLGDLAPFSQYKSKELISAVKYQLHSRVNRALVDDETLYGYLGGLITSDEAAKMWVENGGRLVPDHEAAQKALVVTILARKKTFVERVSFIKFIRLATRHYDGMPIYFMRSLEDGTNRRMAFNRG